MPKPRKFSKVAKIVFLHKGRLAVVQVRHPSEFFHQSNLIGQQEYRQRQLAETYRKTKKVDEAGIAEMTARRFQGLDTLHVLAFRAALTAFQKDLKTQNRRDLSKRAKLIMDQTYSALAQGGKRAEEFGKEYQKRIRILAGQQKLPDGFLEFYERCHSDLRHKILNESLKPGVHQTKREIVFRQRMQKMYTLSEQVTTRHKSIQAIKAQIVQNVEGGEPDIGLLRKQVKALESNLGFIHRNGQDALMQLRQLGRTAEKLNIYEGNLEQATKQAAQRVRGVMAEREMDMDMIRALRERHDL